MTKYSTYLGLVFILLIQILGSQKATAQLTTVGKEFWFGFMENNTNGQNGTAVIVVSANEAAQGTIDLSNFRPGLTYTFNLQQGQNYTLRVPESQDDLLHRNSGRIENKGIHIVSSGKVSVYAFNERRRSADGSVILPVSTLGKEYYIASHYEISPNNLNNTDLNQNDESTLLIVGVENDTKVEITPSVRTIDGKAAWTPYMITLNMGQSYQLKAKDDLTGSKVKVVGSNADDCKNVAVFGGNKWTGVGECGSANDHLFQQMYPVTTWGMEFIHIPLKSRSSGELVKIIAAEDDTEISFDGNRVATLDQGEFRAFDFGPDETRTIQGSKPISVTTYSKSQACNDPYAPFSSMGDPFMITYSPNEQLLKSITFEAMNVVQIEYNYVNIIVATEAKGQTVLDGRNIGNSFSVVPSNPSYSFARIDIQSGSHQLENKEGFIAYVYGFGDIESYGYSVGASLENLNFEVQATYDFEVVGENVACLGEETNWSIEPENDIFTHFLWDLGDGSPVKEGAAITHEYAEPGNYTVTITASVSETSCDEQEEIVFEVDVLETKGELEGATMACPDVDEITYTLVNSENVERIDWEVSGGQIVSSTDSSATVLWGGSNDQAFIKAFPFTAEGCPGAPFQTDVVINQRIEPMAPIGDTNICFDGGQRYTYSVSELVDGRAYQWHINNGQIVSGEDQALVEVLWDIPGTIGEIWYEESSTLDAICGGVSESLSVRVSEELVVGFETEDVRCFGDQSGKITLNVQGGAQPYSYKWQHDPNLNQPEAQNLAAGNYTVTVVDSEGCVRILEDLAITQPEALGVSVGTVSGTSCYGKADGEAEISVSGGVPPYQINFANTTSNDGAFGLVGLEGGELTFTITDANQCQVPVSFTVPSPEPLLVNVEVMKRACPGEANGELMAVPTGGNGPFSYTWDYGQATSQVLSGVPKGNYAVTVLDQNGCVSLGSSELVEVAPEVRLPTGFRPDSGGVNSSFQPISNCGLDYTISIYNRWGELVYNGSVGWDGTVEGNPAIDGTYTYLIEYSYVLEGKNYTEQKRGMVTLIK
ncbi:hypothetical protein GCM10028791_43410 [Echinicola sediminis]